MKLDRLISTLHIFVFTYLLIENQIRMCALKKKGGGGNSATIDEIAKRGEGGFDEVGCSECACLEVCRCNMWH